MDQSLLRNFKRVAQFTAQDVVTLTDLAQSFQSLVTTPHVLTEVSNFIDHAPEYRREDLKTALAGFIKLTPERYRPSVELAKLDEFRWLGLADCGLIGLQQEVFIITTDSHLASCIHAQGGRAINFFQLRET